MPASAVLPYMQRIATHISVFLRNVAVGDVIDITRRDGRHFRYRADSAARGSFRRLGHRSNDREF